MADKETIFTKFKIQENELKGGKMIKIECPVCGENIEVEDSFICGYETCTNCQECIFIDIEQN